MTEEQKTQRTRDWTFRGFLIGVLVGSTIGLGVVAWYGGVGYPGKRYPQVHIGFWAMTGGLLGLTAGVLHRLTRRK